jgi:hypothetical protein
MSALAMTLYQIEDSILFALDTIESLPDYESGMRAELEERLANLVDAQLKKVDGIAHMLAHFEAQTALAAAEVKRLQARKQAFERATERLEKSVRSAMESANLRKLEGETSTLSLRTAPPSVFIIDENLVPTSYKVNKTEIVIDKLALKRALASGTDVPGAALNLGNSYLVRR